MKKKNRFYYSKQQDEVSKRISGLFPYSKTYVKNDNGEYVQYSEWCSLEYSTCNWEDAVLVYETDDDEEAVDRVYCGKLKEGMIEAKIKKDLRDLIKPSMLVIMRDGSINMVMQTQNDIVLVEVEDDKAQLCDCTLHVELSDYNENLMLSNYKSTCDSDIMKIYGFEMYSYLAMRPITVYRELIWEREK